MGVDNPDSGNPALDAGFSLDQLSQAFQSLLRQGDDPYSIPVVDGTDPLLDAANSSQSAIPGDIRGSEDAGDILHPGNPDEAVCPITPRSLVEVMLFVGRPDQQPISSAHLASLMRGVTAAEIDELVRDLNHFYVAADCPYTIESLAGGYRLSLRSEYARMRDALFGRVRPARLSPAAVDVLAIVAYNQPLTSEAVEQQRGTPSGAILSQLVRRQLLQLERPPESPRTPLYRTTPRFLKLFGLKNLEDLPKVAELER
ncbi:MAG: SMC-Scp complex subunit ScpB [Pirellulales bacterium]|nr:SMC-Scp complex subunit ScpB [Pirellulales bacterium]